MEGFDLKDAETQLGLNLVGEHGFSISKIPAVTQFLNRILNVNIDTQNLLFGEFIKHMENAVQYAIDTGTYTAGVELYSHDGAVQEDSKEAFRDEGTGATSEYRMIKAQQPVTVKTFEETEAISPQIRFKRDRETGLVYAFRPASTRMGERGEVIPTYHRYSPTDRVVVDGQDYRFKYDLLKSEEAEPLWNQQVKDAPSRREETVHLVTGALLPIWDRLPQSSPKIIRMELDDGRSLLGRQIPDQELTRTLEALGVDGPNIEMTPEQMMDSVKGGSTILLSSGHKILRRRVGGEQRVEIISPQNLAYQDTNPNGTLQRLGFNMERINYKTRAFIADSDKGRESLKSFMMGKSIANVTTERQQRVDQGPLAPYRESMAESNVYRSFKASLDKMGLPDVELQFDPYFEHQGKVYMDHFGKVAITIGKTIKPNATLGHESIHIFKHMGMFTRQEWDTLAKDAKAEWIERYDIDVRYPDLTTDERVEEAVAEAFGEFYQEKNEAFKPKAPAKAALRKIANFFRAVANWSKGQGFQTSTDIMNALARGEFKKRKKQPPKGWVDQTARLMEQRKRRSSGPQSTGGNMSIPDRYVWDALSQENASILQRAKDVKGALGDRFDLIRTRIQDRFLPVLRAQQVVERELGGKVPEELNIYLAEEMFSGRAGHKLDRITFDYMNPIIEIIGDTKGMTPETVGRYLYARHAQERNERIAEINEQLPDGGSGMGTEEAAEILAEISEGKDAEAYAKIGKLIDDLRESTIDLRVKMGLMTEIEANGWRSAYKHYVPLKGWAETDNAEAELDVGGVGRGYNVRGQETQRALGRVTEAYNPLIGALTQAQEAVVRAEKNRVGQHIYRMAKDVPAKELWEAKKTETKRVFNESTGLVEERSVNPISLLMAENEMAVKVDGKEQRIIFNDQRLARAANRVGVDGLGPIGQILSKFGRYFSAINTMLSPVFVVKNFVRDVVTANINIGSREMGNKIRLGMMKDLPRAMRGAYRGLGGRTDTEWAGYYKEFSEAGGKVSFWVLEQPEASSKRIEQRLRREAGGVGGMALGIITPSVELNPVLRAIERVNLAVDNAARLSAFVHARKNGYSIQEAASLAENLTVDFNSRGDYGSAINAAYVFANSAIQGTQVIFKALKSRQVKLIVTGMTILGYLLDQANAYLSDEDEDGQLFYDKIPDYKHEMSLVLMRGGSEGVASDAMSMWLPYGFNVFPYIGNRISQLQRGKITATEALGGTSKVAFNAFAPISGQNFVQLMTPTALDPALEIALNEDFLGRPIYPDYPNMRGPDSQRFFGTASNASRAIADRLNAWTGGTYAESGYVDVSPETIDHIGAFLTGGVGRTIGKLTDAFTKVAKGEELEVNDIPLIRQLHIDVGAWTDRSLYFERREEIRNAYAAAKDYAEHGDPIPEDIRWKAAMYKAQLAAEKMRRGTKTVPQNEDRAYLLLNRLYVQQWQKHTPYSSESIFD